MTGLPKVSSVESRNAYLSSLELFVNWLEINHKKDFKRFMKLFQDYLWGLNQSLGETAK